MGILSTNKKYTSVVGLDLGQSVVKMVEYSKSEKQILAIAKLFVETSEWDDNKNLKSKLQNWLIKNIQGKKPELCACLSISQTNVRTIAVSADEKRFIEAVSWDVDKYSATPRSENHLVFQAQKYGNPRGQTLILSALCSKTIVKRTMQLLSFLSLPLTTLDIDTFATINAFAANYPKLISMPVVIIKADLEFIQCIYTLHGQYIQHQLIDVPSGFMDMSGEERTRSLIQIGQNIHHTYNSIIPAQSGSPKLFICGDLSSDADLNQLIQNQTGQKPEPLDAFLKIPFPCAPEDLDKAKETAPQCATAVGLALRHKGDC